MIVPEFLKSIIIRCTIISEARSLLIASLVLPCQQGDTIIIDRAFEPLAWFIRCTFLSHPVEFKYRLMPI